MGKYLKTSCTQHESTRIRWTLILFMNLKWRLIRTVLVLPSVCRERAGSRLSVYGGPATVSRISSRSPSSLSFKVTDLTCSWSEVWSPHSLSASNTSEQMFVVWRLPSEAQHPRSPLSDCITEIQRALIPLGPSHPHWHITYRILAGYTGHGREGYISKHWSLSEVRGRYGTP